MTRTNIRAHYTVSPYRVRTHNQLAKTTTKHNIHHTAYTAQRNLMKGGSLNEINEKVISCTKFVPHLDH